MSDENQDQKLKDLEQSLAEELGTGLENKNSDSEAKPQDSHENLSNEAVDAILKDKDPQFAASLDQLKKDLDETTKDINLSVDVPAEMTTMEQVDSEHKVSLSKQLKDPQQLLSNIRSLIKKISYFLSSVLYFFKSINSSVLYRLKNLSRLQKLQLVALIVLIVITLLFGYLVVTRQTFNFTKKDKYLASFETVADQKFFIGEDAEWEEFKNSLRDPEYIVLIKKMIVNLKPTARSTSKPMAAIELYIETSSKESAVEVKDREMEFRDIIGRVFEALPYDDIVEAEGKEKLKLFIRSELNKVINNGRVKKVYFKTLFYKR